MATEQTKPIHFKSLTGIRAIAAIMIFVYHNRKYWKNDLHPEIFRFCNELNLGVQLFFVLSGFLITTILMQEWKKTGKISFKQFYLRRALRILPALFLLLLVCCLYALTQSKIDAMTTLKSVAATLFYVANWYIALNIGISGPLTHTWSLSVEEQFYTVLPIFLSIILWLKLNKRLFKPNY